MKKIRLWIRGALKSKTIWLGTSVSMLGYFQQREDLITQIVGTRHSGLIILAIGALVIVLRAVTTQSLADRCNPKEAGK